VSQNGRALHIVFPHQFLDSPEWFGVSTDEYFQVNTVNFCFTIILPVKPLQVSITAMEDARVLLWHRDKLKLSIITDQFLQAVFDHILGRDVVKKLMQVSVRWFLFLFIFCIIDLPYLEYYTYKYLLKFNPPLFTDWRVLFLSCMRQVSCLCATPALSFSFPFIHHSSLTFC
jgi:hypothetical protein